MFNWLRKKLSVPTLCSVHQKIRGDTCPACVAYTRGYGEAKRHYGPKPQRYEEIERDRTRRKKRLNKEYGVMVQQAKKAG